MPMIYLHKCLPNTQFEFEVVDGQQRLRAIWEFYNGKYALSENLEPIKELKLSHRKYTDLPPELKTRFRNFKIATKVIDRAGQPELSRLFSRMQMGVQLIPPELRNAIQSPLRHAIDAAAGHKFFEGSKISSARFKHQDYLAHAISISIHAAKKDLKALQLKEDYEKITNKNIYASAISDANRILDFLHEINLETSRRITQKWIFVDLYYLLYLNREKLRKISRKDFANVYLQFDKDRRKYNAKPEELIEGSPIAQNITQRLCECVPTI